MGPRHLVLVGLPGVGKTAVGREVAATLGAAFVDLDQVVEAAAGLSPAQIITTLGEAHFRELERDAMARIMAEPPRVIATGGGWAAQPGNQEAVEGQALVIYLKAPPRVVADRIGDTGSRPLLAGAPPAIRLAELLARREKAYRRSGHEVDTEQRTIGQSAEVVVTLARKHGGW